jgi:hypothetical protein
MTSNAVADRIAVGEQSRWMPESTQAMKHDHIGFAHLTVMARTAAAVGDAFDERRLLDMAQEMSPGKFHYQCLHYRHAVDAQRYAAEQASEAESNVLHMSSSSDGMLYLTGFFDSINGAVVRNALEPLARPAGVPAPWLRGESDHRLRPHRLADGFVELCSGRKPANIQVTASIETLKGLAGAPGGEMEFSLPIASSIVQRMACDCSVTRVLLDQDSLVIDVGRSTPKIHPTLRKALEVRDKQCQWPGCEREASRCDGHHFVHWIAGGPTDLDNLTLLCRRHHRLVHEFGWQLVRVEGKITAVAPATRFARPRAPD